jgi:choline dehydrogenase
LHRNGQTEMVQARTEVILAAGAIGSPDILLRSGIGPAAQIAGWGGAVLHDLPGVGQNLQDHVDCMIVCASRSRTPYGISLPVLPRLARDGLRWIFGQRGMLSSNMVEAGGFVRSSPEEMRPDIQFHIIPGRKSHRGRMVEYGHGIALHTCVLRPQSRGSVTRSGPEGAPDIDLGLLTNDADMVRLLRGLKLARQILQQEPMAQLGLTEIIPGADVTTDAGLRAFVRAHARTVYHPVGTCAMGVGGQAVVDARLRVHGLAGLRVVDASVMPTIVSGNTNAPAIMIAEKAADMIAADRKAG